MDEPLQPAPCPLITPYTRKIGIPDRTLEKLFYLRNWDIESGDPVPFTWPSRLRRMEYSVVHERETEEPFDPRNYQLQMAHHLARMPRFLCGDAVGLGKAQPLTAKILTPSGWSTMGEMAVGMTVVDPDGGSAVVEGVYPRGERLVYRVETTDGEVTECCGEHLWTIQTADDRSRRRPWRTWSTEQILAYGLHRGTSKWKTARIFLPLTEAVTFHDPDPAIHERLPPVDAQGTIDQRMERLRGWMDTDGECTKQGIAYFHTLSTTRRNDVRELVLSLGGITQTLKTEGIALTVKTPFNPFHLARKARRWKHPNLARSIKSITPIGVKPVQCIRVSSKRNLYLTDGYIVTHNTIDAILATTWLHDHLPKQKIIILATKSTTMQWADEFRRFSTLRPYVLQDKYGKKKSYEARYAQFEDFLTQDNHDVLICKYSSLRGKRRQIKEKFDEDGYPVGTGGVERISREIKKFAEIIHPHGECITLITDEAHKYKGTKSQARVMIQVFEKPCKRVWAMTATAIKNNLDEMYAIAAAIGIRPFGSMAEFRDEFCLYRNVHVGGGRQKPTLTGYRNLPKFRNGMRPFFLGRSQAQVKEPLPKLTTLIHPLDLSEEQARLLLEDIPSGAYQLPPALVKYRGEWQERERDFDNAMTALAVHQLVANHPALLDPRDVKGFFTKTLSPKEECLLDMLDGDFQGEKVIVFSKYRMHIDRLEGLTKNGHFTERKFLRITGAENEQQRADAKNKFQEPGSGYDTIFINSAALEGINLQAAGHMICLDLPFGLGDLIQLVGRMLRMASIHTMCTLHILSAKGSIDEFVIETLRGKKGLFEAILGESHTAGLLDDRHIIDLASGMEKDMTSDDNVFIALLKAHVKSIGMSSFTSGEMLEEARSDTEYKMVFEPGAKKRSKRASHWEEADLEELEEKWR